MRESLRRVPAPAPGASEASAPPLPAPSWTIAAVVVAALAINESTELYVGAGAIGLLSIAKTCLAVQWIGRMAGGILRVSFREYCFALLLDATPAIVFLVRLLMSMGSGAFHTGRLDWGGLVGGTFMAVFASCLLILYMGVWASPIVFWIAFSFRLLKTKRSWRSHSSWLRISAWGILPAGIILSASLVMTQPILGWRVSAARSSFIEIATAHSRGNESVTFDPAETAGSFRVSAMHRDAKGIRFETGKSGILSRPAGIAWCPGAPPRTWWDNGRSISFTRITDDWYKWREEVD